MIEVIQTIAALCQISAGLAYNIDINKTQIACHKYYATCLAGDLTTSKLYTCIQKRSE